MKRSAAASFALAAAGMLYSRLGGRKQHPEPEHEEPVDPAERPASGAEVDRARSELAAELRRRASRPPADT